MNFLLKGHAKIKLCKKNIKKFHLKIAVHCILKFTIKYLKYFSKNTIYSNLNIKYIYHYTSNLKYLLFSGIDWETFVRIYRDIVINLTLCTMIVKLELVFSKVAKWNHGTNINRSIIHYYSRSRLMWSLWVRPKSDSINQMLTITNYFYLVSFGKWNV